MRAQLTFIKMQRLLTRLLTAHPPAQKEKRHMSMHGRAIQMLMRLKLLWPGPKVGLALSHSARVWRLFTLRSWRGGVLPGARTGGQKNSIGQPSVFCGKFF